MAVLATASFFVWSDRDSPGRADRSGDPSLDQLAAMTDPDPQTNPADQTDAGDTALPPSGELRQRFPEIDEDELYELEANVLDQLGRVPRREILDPLLAAWRASETGEEFLRAVGNRIPRTDFLLLWYSHHWEYYEENPRPPFTRSKGKGVDPYFNPKYFAGERFPYWYLAYRGELELPALSAEELHRLDEGWVEPLGTLPNPDSLRLGARLLARYQQRMQHLQDTYGEYEFNTPEDRAVEDGEKAATRELFAGIQAELPAAEYDRLRKSIYWGSAAMGAGVLRWDE